MASIKRRPDGVWRARYRDREGKEHAGHFATRGNAQAWQDEKTTQLVTGTHVDPGLGRRTFEAYVKDWKGTKAGLSPRTRINVEGRIENYATPFFGRMRLASVCPLHARAFVADLV